MASKITLTLHSGQKVPALGLGTGSLRDQEGEESINAALEKGYRHLDTAFAYQNEEVIGRVLQKWLSSGKLKREDLFITTKLPFIGVHQDRVEMFLKKSLENLQLDYVDLYLVHFPLGAKYKEGITRQIVNEKGETELEGKTDHVAIWKKMEEQVDAGRAKHIGLSNYNVSQIQTVLQAARIKPSNLQVELHVYLQQRELVDFCHKNGISVVAYAPLGSPGRNKNAARMGRPLQKLPDILGDEVIGKLAEKYSKSPAQVALRFLLQRGVGAIPKSSTPKRLDENMNVFDFNLTDGEMERLYELDQGEEARVCDFKGFQNHPDYPFVDRK